MLKQTRATLQPAQAAHFLTNFALVPQVHTTGIGHFAELVVDMPAATSSSASRTQLRNGITLPAQGSVPTPQPFTGEQFAPQLSLAKEREERQLSGSYEPPVALCAVPDASPAIGGYGLALDAQHRMHAERLAHSHPWEVMDLQQRLRWVKRFRCLVAEQRAQLCKLMHEDLSLDTQESFVQEVLPLLAACKWLEKRAASVLRDRAVGDAPFWLKSSVREVRVPLGKVGIIASWPSPLAQLGIHLAHALAAGNRVVVKPSEKATRTQTRLLELAIEAGLPPGTLEWTGSSRDAGATMLATRSFDHVIFTGSTEVGSRVATTLAKSLTPATLELHARDTAFVLADANPKHAAKTLWAALQTSNGQACTAPRRVLVVGEVYHKLLEELAKLACNAQPRALIDEKASEHCKQLVARATGKGARDLGLHGTLPNALAINVPTDTVDRFFRPTVLGMCDPTMEVVQGKHVGPLLAIVRCVNIEEALRIHSQCEHHRSASIFTRDQRVGELLGKRLALSTILINDCAACMAHPAISVSGSGPSGMGIARGEEGLLAMTHTVHVMAGAHNTAKLAKKRAAWRVRFTNAVLAWWYGAGKSAKLPRAGQVKGREMGAISPARSVAAEGAALPLPPESTEPAKPIVHTPAPIQNNAGAGKRPL